MQEVNVIILKAINEAIQATGSQSALARKVGITQSMLCRYISGRVKTISAKTWKTLYPVIADYLPKGYVNNTAFDITNIILRESWKICGTNEKIIEEEDRAHDKYMVSIETTSGRRHDIPMEHDEFLLWKRLPDNTRSFILLKTVAQFDEFFLKHLIKNRIWTKAEAREHVAPSLQKFIDETPDPKPEEPSVPSPNQ